MSVRFFKRIFLCILLLIFLIPVALAASFGVSRSREAEENKQLRAQLEQLQASGGQTGGVTGPDGASFPYQELYPELYCEPERPDGWQRSENTVYLTFDDGPSANTAAILDVLAAQGVKATFFVGGSEAENAPELLRRIVEEGHTIGIHTYSHQYRELYSSVESYLADFKQVYDMIYEATGVKAEIFRFPGGSINGYNGLIYEQLIAELTRRGFTYYDWNVTGGDSISGATAQDITYNVVSGMEGIDRAVVALHDFDGGAATVEALPGIIEQLRQGGNSFAALTPEVSPIIFGYASVS